jgi:tetratricopeptide (TPR) repeat protein
MVDERLVRQLKEGNDSQRRAASYRLGNSGDPDAVPHLILAYTDKDWSVRRNVVEGLKKISSREASYFIEAPEYLKQRIVQDLQQTGKITIEDQQSDQASTRVPEPTEEAKEHLRRAIELSKTPEGSEPGYSLMQDMLAELALAIHKAGAPYPEAHTFMAMVYLQLEDNKNAQQHADLALHLDPNQFDA